MPHPPCPLPDDLGRQFSAARAVEQGITRRRLRAKDLASPFYGVRRCVDNESGEGDDAEYGPLSIDRQQRARVLRDAHAYAEVMPAGSFFCGRTAAVLHGAAIDHPGDLEVGVVSPGRAPRARGIRGRRIAEHLVSVRTHEGLRVASPASTWAMLCTELSVRELVTLGDAMARIPRDDFGRQHPELALATLTQLHAAADAGPRPPGTGRLRAAIEKVRVGSSSPLETEYRLDAATGGLPEPELDVEIRSSNGRLLGISEVVYRESRLIVEIEGDHHRTSRAQWNRDIEKYQAYAEAGWEVVRLTSTHIRGSRPTGISIVRKALLRRGWDGAPK
ncbi:hypothetical protein [Microbacterium sp. LWO13-1.2]|uniref:hypothetical protein n=1 Tax=Microbacterium sp. LWO13-1.2 TaxID=3135262 RepID=UPI003139114C